MLGTAEVAAQLFPGRPQGLLGDQCPGRRSALLRRSEGAGGGRGGAEAGWGGAHLPKLLINDSELEVIADNVFIKGDDEPGRLWDSTGCAALHTAVC